MPRQNVRTSPKVSQTLWSFDLTLTKIILSSLILLAQTLCLHKSNNRHIWLEIVRCPTVISGSGVVSGLYSIYLFYLLTVGLLVRYWLQFMICKELPSLYIANRLRWKSFTVVEINCNSLENIHGCMVILYGQTLLHRLFHWKSFAVTDQSMKNAKLFHLEQFVMNPRC